MAGPPGSAPYGGGPRLPCRYEVRHGGLVEEGPHALGGLLPAEVRRTGREIAAPGTPQHATPPLRWKERPHDGIKRQLLGPGDQLEAAERTAGRAKDAGAGQLVKSLGQIVARNAERLGDVADAHGLPAGRLGNVVDGAK